MKLEKREEEKAKKEAGQGENIPDNLITWVFQDDFIPRGKITKDGNYSIISDYLGTPVEAYDEEGKKVWKRNLDIYGRVKTEEALAVAPGLWSRSNVAVLPTAPGWDGSES